MARMQIPDSTPMSQRAYAERRGVSHTSVRRAIAAGRLRESLDAEGRIVNAELADKEWAESTDLSKAPMYVRERADVRARGEEPVPRGGPPPGTPGTLAENNTQKAYWQAQQARLDYLEAAGKLVPAKDVDAALQTTFRQCQTKLLGIPSRARQALPELSLEALATLERLIREALEELASGGGR